MLALFFFLVALIYSSVGFGGGSSYNALLILYNVDYKIIPIISLLCNLIVVFFGVIYAKSAGFLNLKKSFYFVLLSIPLSFLGGYLLIPKNIFLLILGTLLFLSSLKMFFIKNDTDLMIKTRELNSKYASDDESASRKFLYLMIGAIIGFLGGITGIGGGIFLAPILYIMKWGTPKEIAGLCSFFILVNSAAGLIGQFLKLHNANIISDVFPFWTLFLGVFFGGQIGTLFGVFKIPKNIIQFLTALLVFYVSLKILFNLWT